MSSTNFNPLSAPNTVGNSATSGAQSGNVNPRTGSEQRDMFMTLLVAQLKHQDPLQPQDGAQFVAQLSQFNSLDQLIGIRQTLEQMVAATQVTRSESA